jgi:hypothetical protein
MALNNTMAMGCFATAPVSSAGEALVIIQAKRIKA